MNRILTKKQIILLVSLLLAVLTATGLTLAWLTVKTGTLTNNFTPGVIEITMAKSGSGNSYSATVTNDGTKSNVSAYVRMAAVPTFQADSNGTTLIHYTKPTVSVTYDGWTIAEDGFYYYNKALAVGDTTTPITVTTTSSAPSGYAYTVEFASEAIQTDPASVQASAWPLVAFGTDVAPAIFVPANKLPGATTVGEYVYLDVANTAVANYVQLGGIDHPSINNNQYYRMNAYDPASYGNSAGSSTLRGAAAALAGGTIRFRVTGNTFSVKAVQNTSYTYCDDGSRRITPSFDIFYGTGVDRTYHSSVSVSYDADCSFTVTLPTDPNGSQEVMICLPYTMGYSKIEIGVPVGASVAPPSERLGGKIGFYGSSITQGYDTATSGFSYAMMLCHAMDADCANFGFSGSALGEELVINDICAKITAAKARGETWTAFVLDYDWNIESSYDLENGGSWVNGIGHYEIYRRLRAALGEDVPIIMLSRPYYGSFSTCGLSSEADVLTRIGIIQKTFEKAKAAGDDKVAFVSGRTFFKPSEWGNCHPAGNVHPNNTGFESMYNAVLPILNQLLADNGEKPGSYVQHSGTNKFTQHTYASEGVVGTATDAYQTYANMTLLEATNCSDLRGGGWTGDQRLIDGLSRYTFYITYNEAKWVNEIHLAGSKNNDTSRLAIYYSDGNSGWTPVDLEDDVHVDSENRLVFTFKKAVKAKNFMVHAANPSASCYYNWYEENFFGVYDPEGSANDSEVAQPLPPLDKIALNIAYTGDNRTGRCFYGYGTLSSTVTNANNMHGGMLFSQVTNGTDNVGLCTYNTAVDYANAVTFNTFTVFQSAIPYGNYRYAEIWYTDEDIRSGEDPRNYWTKAEVQGVVKSTGTVSDMLCRYVWPSANSMNEAYTYVLAAPVTAKHIMVNFVYEESRAGNEGEVYQFISYAGYDASYDSSKSVALPQLNSLSLDSALVSGRTGVMYYGSSSGTFANDYTQSTNQGEWSYASGAKYTSPVTFNTYTSFPLSTNPYENFAYAEIWYYNGTPLDGVDPLTYWQKASLQGVVRSDSSQGSELVSKVYNGSVTEAYTWVLTTPVEANNVLVRFVYHDSRAGGEGEVFQMLSYAGYDVDYVLAEPNK